MRLVIDIETDGLYDDVTKVWCAVIKDIDKGTVVSVQSKFSSLKNMLDRATLVIGHNIIDYDLPVLEKILGITYTGEVFDTYTASCLLNPDRKGGHSLEAWGKRLGFAKGDFNDWSKFSSEMLDYCIDDVLLSEKVYYKLEKEISK